MPAPTHRGPHATVLSPYRLALRFGLTDVAALLQARTDVPEISDDERFVAACARGDEAEARAVARDAARSAGRAVAGAIAIACRTWRRQARMMS